MSLFMVFYGFDFLIYKYKILSRIFMEYEGGSELVLAQVKDFQPSACNYLTIGILIVSYH